MIRGARTSAAGIAAHDFVRLLEMDFLARSASGMHTFGSARSAMTRLGIVGGDAGEQQALARQIQPAEAGIFIDIAQNVGQLQRAAEMMCEQDAVALGQAKHPHRQPPDRARHAIAIEIERGHVGRADVLRHVHLHAVDDGKEILALEAEGFDGGFIVAQPRRADGR